MRFCSSLQPELLNKKSIFGYCVHIQLLSVGHLSELRITDGKRVTTKISRGRRLLVGERIVGHQFNDLKLRMSRSHRRLEHPFLISVSTP